MADPRYACGWVPRFLVAALVRSDPSLRGRPVAVLAAAPGTRVVLAATPEAWARGVRPGMSASAAMTWAPDLVGRDRDAEAERSATGALLDAAWASSPRVERRGADGVALDLAGLAPLFGDEARVGQRLLDAITALDLPAHVVIADTRIGAALVARREPGVTVVLPGGTARALGPMPVGLLAPPPEVTETLERWGIRTLGALAALPPAALRARLGRPGAELQALARGEDAGPFVAAVPAPCWMEALALDWEVASLDGFAFVLRRLIERLAARLQLRELGACALTLTVRLADGGAHVHRLPLVAPLADPRTLVRLLLAGLESLVLPAPIVALAVEADAAPLGRLQGDLFAPPRPSPRELGETLGRLAALVGPGRVGAPVLPDTHRPGAIGVGPLVTGSGSGAAPPPDVTGRPLVCRRLVPPLPAAVTVDEGQPRVIEAAGVRGPVVACAGPWRTAGEWWADTAWAREEWDVALADGAVYRLACDRATDTWTLDAVYD